MSSRARKLGSGVVAFFDDFGRALEAKRLYSELSGMSEAQRHKLGYKNETLAQDVFNQSFGKH